MKAVAHLGTALLAVTLLTAATAHAGGKPDGATCHVHKSCASKLCLRQTPTDKFGKCCDAEDCPSLNAQCGTIDNGCGVPIQCGDCNPGTDCVNNQCVQVSTTTTTSTTSTTNIDGCGNKQCEDAVVCGEGCFAFQTPESTCGVCSSDFACVQSNCTASSDCAQGEVCAIRSCCGNEGICTPLCNASTTTTTTTTSSTTSTTATTSTTIAIVGVCEQNGDNQECTLYAAAFFACNDCCSADAACEATCNLAVASSCSNSAFNDACAAAMTTAGCQNACCD